MSEVTAQVLEDVRSCLAAGSGELTPHRVAEALRAAGRPVGDATVLAVHDALRRDVLGAGPLEPLLRLADVTDVLVNGPDEVYLDRGQGLERSEVPLSDDAAVRRLAQRLAAVGGRRLDDATPYVDVRLQDGTRFHAVLAPLARPGTTLSLRVPRNRVFTLDEAGFRADLAQARAAIEEAAGACVTGYRAPSFSIDARTSENSRSTEAASFGIVRRSAGGAGDTRSPSSTASRRSASEVKARALSLLGRSEAM